MIPAYNCSCFLEETLKSVLAQDMGPDQMQIEVVDDASTDADVEALVRRLGQGRVSYYRQPQNVGSLRNFETCLNRSRGQLIHLLHGDDRIHHGFYRKMTKVFKDFPEAGAAFCRVAYIDERGRVHAVQDTEVPEAQILDNWLEKIAEKQRAQYVSMVVKRSVYEHLGAFYGAIYGEDWEMWTRIARHYPVAYTPELLAEYRGHQGSISSLKALHGRGLDDLLTVINNIQNHLPEDKKKRILTRSKRHYSYYGVFSAIQTWEMTGDVRNIFPALRASFRLHSSIGLVFFMLKLLLKKAARQSFTALNRLLSSSPSDRASVKWDWEVSSKTRWWDLDLAGLWAYRKLLARLVRRDFLVSYQQTLLGPLWMLLQPILTVFIYVLVFNRFVGLSTGSVPPVLFYLSGTVLWNFFNEVFTGTSNTFTANAELFGKVYFPRLVIPLSITSSQFLRLLIQLGLLTGVLVYYWTVEGMPFRLNAWFLFAPVAILLVAGLSLALGLILSVITAKYRDLSNFSSLAVRMLMFVTPVIYPLSGINPANQWLLALNPLTPLFEAFRYGLLGEGTFATGQLIYSSALSGVLLMAGILLFNKQKETVMDFL